MSALVLYIALTIGAAFFADSLAWQKGRNRRAWVFATVLLPPLVLVLVFLPALAAPAAAEPGEPIQ